jgi:hypothetical protein
MSLGAENRLLMAAAAQALCPALVAAIWRERKIDPAEVATRRQELHGLTGSLALVCMAVTTTARHRDPDRSFFARHDSRRLAVQGVGLRRIPRCRRAGGVFRNVQCLCGALSLVAQFFVASRLLRRFGLGVALLIVPVALTFGSLSVLISGSLLTAVLLKGSD